MGAKPRQQRKHSFSEPVCRRMLLSSMAIVIVSLLNACLPSLDLSKVDYQCVGGKPDGIIERNAAGVPLEQCDDGNLVDGDGCDSGCHIECAGQPNCPGISYQCVGGAPDGNLDTGEQCDDGNGFNGDGCDIGCHVECPAPWIVDPMTFHCYQIVSGAISSDDAVNHCATLPGNPHPVTLHTDEEQAFVAAQAIAGHLGPLRTSYALDVGLFESSDSATPTFLSVQEANIVGGNATLEPGVLAMSLSSPLSCTGCYLDGLSEDGSWWSPVGAGGLLLLDPSSGAFVVAAEPMQPMDTLCERPPAFITHVDPSGAQATFKRYQQLFTYVATPVSSAAQARMGCQQLGAQLASLQASDGSMDDLVREDLLRALGQLGPSLSAKRLWVGLTATSSEDSSWQWDGSSEGLSQDSLPWATVPQGSSNGPECAQLSLSNEDYSTGLLLATSCTDPGIDGNGYPYVCVTAVP